LLVEKRSLSTFSVASTAAHEMGIQLSKSTGKVFVLPSFQPSWPHIVVCFIWLKVVMSAINVYYS
jgi:hypothetical protein